MDSSPWQKLSKGGSEDGPRKKKKKQKKKKGTCLCGRWGKITNVGESRPRHGPLNKTEYDGKSNILKVASGESGRI